MKKILVILTVFMVSVFFAEAASVTVSAVGEADIIGGDKASAKMQAVARAKWAALEQASGVKVKTETIVQNAVLVDEAVKNEVSSVVQSYKITGEEEDGNTYRVMVSAVIIPEKAQLALTSVARNTSISVMIPVVFPDKHVEETNVLTETLINELTKNQLEVIDIAEARGASSGDLDRAMKTNNYMAMRNIASKYLSGTILIGKVDTVTTAKEGSDIGYGVSLPFNVVTGRLSYRLIIQQGLGTKVLASGYLTAKGMGATVEDATANMMERMTEEVSTSLVSIVLEQIKGLNNRKIKVQLVGNPELDDLLELKQVLSYTAWVLEVDEKGKDTLMVSYPEKSLYLANSIAGKPVYKIKKLNDYLIEVERAR